MSTTVSSRTERDRLLDRYASRIQTNPRLDRSLVSFQANRDVAGFGWLKYREAFSGALAGDIIERYTQPGEVVLDPFAGIGTAIFAARGLGRRAIGIELLPVGALAIEARLAATRIDPGAFTKLVRRAARVSWTRHADPAFAQRHIAISAGAYSPDNERAITGFRAWCAKSIDDDASRRLFHLAALDVLESVSFTRKDGQYLRWDGRARPGKRSAYRKPRILDFGEAIRDRLTRLADDFAPVPAGDTPDPELLRGSCLELLPDLDAGSVDLVLTSPPYCNRYDYTRTYALELVWLGLDDEQVKDLRQTMLSCTVENAEKIDQLRHAYRDRGRPDVSDEVLACFDGQAALHEVLTMLEDGRPLNNTNIPRMVRNYFLEMAFVIHELTRVLRPGGRVVMVNDNVRYAGEEVPVDLILSDLAAGLGLEVEHIWTLARGKGNSSQQMGAHGRTELRKCVYVWSKP